MKKALPEAGKMMITEMKETFKKDKESIQMIESFIKEKEKKYQDEELFIVHHTVAGDKESAHVTATACSLEEFILHASEKVSEQQDDATIDNFAPGFLNRNGFSVSYKKPFI